MPTSPSRPGFTATVPQGQLSRFKSALIRRDPLRLGMATGSLGTEAA
jgi:hypothetical protein